MNPTTTMIVNPQVVVDDIARDLINTIEKMNHALELGIETQVVVQLGQDERGKPKYQLGIRFSRQIFARVSQAKPQ